MSDQKIISQPSDNSGDVTSIRTISVITGRLISLFVHETNNHLAALRESAGLGDDILSAQNLTDKDKLKELEKLLAAMDDRMGHAASLVRALSEFGRHMEYPSAGIDVNQAIAGIMPFLLKIARQKNLSIRTAYGNDLPAAAGQVSVLQCLVLAIFDNFSSGLDPKTTATITTVRTLSSPVINLAADCSATSVPERHPWPWKTLESFAAAYGYGVTRSEQGGTVTIVITKHE